ncbi:MAG TPA: T9SS type A sorting domain-containing protein [bacterium]|nr:T9SS type A sorting domain-containing protein [bacterium]
MNAETRSGRGRICSATVCAILAALAGPALAGYGFTLVPRGDTVQHVGQNGTAVFLFTLANTGTSPDVFRFDCRVVSGPTAWAVACCDRGQCHQPGDAIYDTLAAGASDTTPDITVYTDTTQGEEVVALRVRSMADSSLAESIATHTLMTSGIEEAPQNPPRVLFHVSPQPVGRGRQATVAFSTSGPARFSLDLYDAVGNWVSTLAQGIAFGGNHTLPFEPAPNLPTGVYLIRLAVGNQTATSKLIID